METNINPSMNTAEVQRNIATLIIRVALGGVIFAHGAQKLFGWFGGYGFAATMDYFTGTAGLPYVIGLLVILGESLGAIALIVGIFGRFMAGCMFIIMLGALIIDHAQYGFFMNWFGNQPGEGIEFDLLTFGISLSLILTGSGDYSMDALLRRLLRKQSKTQNLASV
jgi:putative oxidoreductase